MAERRGRFWESSGGWWGRTRRREDGGGWELLHNNTLPLVRFQYQFFLHFKIFYPILNLYLTHEYLVYKNALFIPLCSDGPLLAQFRFTCSPCLAEWCCSHVVQFTSVVRELGLMRTVCVPSQALSECRDCSLLWMTQHWIQPTCLC